MTIGPYQILGELGRGGMGVVYRARRADLDREFALKVLDPATASPEAVARFVREGRAAARLAGRPGIVAVHDVGEAFVASDATNARADAQRAAPDLPGERAAHTARPVLYLVMDLIEGRTLEALAADGDMDWRRAAAYLEEAARAVHDAHQAGILHRDLKPSNILVGRPAGGDGPGVEPRAFVADFGLCTSHELPDASRGLTRTGTVLGTPAYMAPEQARGEPADVRTDVYGLGASLFHAASGAPPFVGALHEIVARTLRDPAPPLRRVLPDAPRDLEAIVARCLAKAPADRYPDAAALADDLARLREGRAPAAARADGATRRRHGRRLAAAALLTVAVAVAGGLAVRAREASRTADAALDLTVRGAALQALAGQLVGAYGVLSRETVDAWPVLEARAHGGAATDAEVADALATVRRAAARTRAAWPALAIADAWEGLAETLVDVPEGWARLDRAVIAAGDEPFPALLRARARLAQYARLLPLPGVAFGEAGPIVEPLREGAAATAERTAAALDLDRALARPVWAAVPQARPHLELARAAAALAGGRQTEAAAGFAALADDPLLGREAAFLAGTAHLLAGRAEAAARAWSGSGVATWRRAGEQAAVAWLAVACEATARGVSPDAALAAARDRLEAVRAVAGESPWLAWYRGLAHLQGAQYTARPVAERARLLKAACAELDVAVAAGEDSARCWLSRSTARMTLARLRVEANVDAEALLAGAAADADRVAALRPGTPDAPAAHAHIALVRATGAAGRGADPRPALDAALAAFGEALAAAAGDPALSNARGLAAFERGEAEAARGAPGEPWYAGALADFATAVAARPEWPDARNHRGLVHFVRGRAAAEAGADPQPAYAAARADYDAALALRPEFPEALVNRGNVRRRLADALPEGTDARPAYETAVADYEAALAIAPGYAMAHANRGIALRRCAAADAAAGRDPRPALRDAIAAFDGALALAPGLPLARSGQANAWAAMGQAEAEAGGDAASAFQRAMAVYDGLLAQTPDDVAVRCNRAVTCESLAEHAEAGRDWATACTWRARALADWEAITTQEAHEPANRGWLGNARYLFARAAGHLGRDESKQMAQAAKDLEAALAARPRMWGLRLNLSQVLVMLDAEARAIAVLEETLRLDPPPSTRRLAEGELARQRGRAGR